MTSHSQFAPGWRSGARALPGVHVHRIEGADASAARGTAHVLSFVPEFVEEAGPGQVEFRRDDGALEARVPLAAGSDLYGTGAVAGPFLRNGKVVELWNTDAFAYGSETTPLYQSHPWVVILDADGSARGWLAASTFRGRISATEDSVCFRFEQDEPFEMFECEGPGLSDVLTRLTELIGRPQLPPLWSLGYHQCRYSYATAEEVRDIAAGFREHAIPCDAIWFDIDYMDRQRVFTWNRASFPDHRALVSELERDGYHAVAIIDPGVVVDESDETYRSGIEGDHFIIGPNARDESGEPSPLADEEAAVAGSEHVEGSEKAELDAVFGAHPDDAPSVGRVWPGPCHFPDFTRGATRAWWAQRVAAFIEGSGVHGLWNDMNEPAIFDVASMTLPQEARHAGLGGGDHGRFHNIYGQLMASATRDGLCQARPDTRPFVLTRANHISGSRFAMTWTGDNTSTWEALRHSIPMILNLGLSGQPFAGPDVPGFFGEPDPELAVRWFSLAAFLPFFRGHAEKTSPAQEPWAFGEEASLAIRQAMRARMRLLPTLYTLAYEASRSGMPICRPLWSADPSDERLRAVDDAFMLGDALLVAPIVEEGASEREVLLPRGDGWFALADGSFHDGETATVEAHWGDVPLFARAGSVLFEMEPTEHTGSFGTAARTLRIFLDGDERAVGTVYEDAGEGFGFQSGEYRLRTVYASQNESELDVNEGTEGSWSPPARAESLVVSRRGQD